MSAPWQLWGLEAPRPMDGKSRRHWPVTLRATELP
ncbi:hypothetical protein GBAR_LOCUS16021 [Geodia barretti]|uniref:Uncharacterized protein n=1 Tax=Geodia barretti TaxID=519541 RepID=A0AA35WNN3_GEOBA|nr:hypothetical protein GBAR_LOCUS16021 [Geodia barretti]